MKKKINFDPAWTIFLTVIGTLITMSFMDDEHTRNLLAAIVLSSCFVLFTASVFVRNLKPVRQKAR